MPGSPVARFAAGSVPATGTSTSVFVVVFPIIKERSENEKKMGSWGRSVQRCQVRPLRISLQVQSRLPVQRPRFSLLFFPILC